MTLNIYTGLFLYMEYVHTREIGRRTDQALPVVIPGSLTVWVYWIVCACTDLFKQIACGMQHMHVYEECCWTCWIGSVLLFFHLKDWCGRGIFGTGCPLSENSFWFMLSASDASEPWRVCIAWLTDLTLKIYRMTRRLIFARSADNEQNLPFPFSSVPSSLMSFLSAFNTFCFAHFSFHTALTFFWLLLPPSHVCFSIKRQGLIHSCISSFCPNLPILNNNVTNTRLHYKTNIIV